MSVTVINNPNSKNLLDMAITVNYFNGSVTLMQALQANQLNVVMNSTNNNSTLFANDGSRAEIHWDPNAAHQVQAADGSFGIQSPAGALVHEIGHFLFGPNEAAALRFETTVMQELGDAVRSAVGQPLAARKYYVENPTLHTNNGQFVQKNLDSTWTKQGSYNGTLTEIIIPSMGWGVGPAGSSPGAGSHFQVIGGVDIIGSSSPPMKRDASYIYFPELVAGDGSDIDATQAYLFIDAAESYDSMNVPLYFEEESTISSKFVEIVGQPISNTPEFL